MKATTFFRRTALWSATVVIVSWAFFPAGSASAGSASYTYDSLGRLTRAEHTNGAVITYVYDAAGNRSSTATTGTGAAALLTIPLASLSVSSATPKTTSVTGTGQVSEQLPIAPLLLPKTGEDPTVYGWNDRSEHPESMVAAVFEGDGADRLLHLQGYAIDTSDEVGLWLNGTLLGYLSPATIGVLSTPSLWLLPAALQLPGENVVELVPRTENKLWGVTRLGFYSLGSGLGNQEGLTGGDLSHAEGFELHLFSQGPLQAAGYLIELAGWDANSGEEITIELNEASLIRLPQSGNRAWGPAYQIWITPEVLMHGDNRLLITNSYGPLAPWGVQIDRILSRDDGPLVDKNFGQGLRR